MTLFRVTDLKQFVYCPRIVYYHYCLPQIRPTTFKMVAGIEAQDEETVRELRRSLRPYGLTRGERHLDLYLSSEELGLRGRVDLVIETDEASPGEPELIPVDYKLSRRGRGNRHFRLQLLAYGMMLSEKRQQPIRRGFLYYIPLRQAVEVPFTDRLKSTLKQVLSQMREIVLTEQMPAPTKQRGKCLNCEFRRFCNDV